MLRRKIDRLLSEGEGKQLAWLCGIVLALFAVFCLLGRIWKLDWTDVLSLYLDAGNFPLDHKANDIFSLVVTAAGVLILSAMLISVFSNVFTNISSSFRSGERRYRFTGHILLLGGSSRLVDMLKALRDNPEFADKEIVVMTSSEVEYLRSRMETALGDAAFCRRVTWYRGERDNGADLRSARPEFASSVYIIGEDNEPDRDSTNIGSLDILERICGGEGAGIPCYVTIDSPAARDIFNYLPVSGTSRLRVEIVDTGDYLAEQLLVDTPFIPVPKQGERLRIVIAGDAPVADAVAEVASHICHFQGFAKDGLRTVISFVGENMKPRMERFVADREGLFELSHYSLVTPEGREDFAPDEAFGDFLDIEWEFIEGDISSFFVRGLLCGWAKEASQRLAAVLCGENSADNLSSAVHLPRQLFGIGVPVAVYQNDHIELFEKAVRSGMYGSLTCFGEARPGADALFLRRVTRGARVNRLYDLKYGNPPAASAEDAWNRLSFAHKLSSIWSAASIPVKLRSFGIEPSRESVDSLDDGTLDALSEVEHRRWMASALMMGYRGATKAERRDRSRFRELKKQFVHLDIAPYGELGAEADKDLLIVRNIPYIINGSAASHPLGQFDSQKSHRRAEDTGRS